MTRPHLKLRDDLLPRIKRFQEQQGLPTQSAALEALIEQRLDETIPRVVKKDRVAYLLRRQTGTRRSSGCSGDFLDVTHADDWELGGGRWLLDWFLLREPDWQTHHRVIFPRHWPLPLHRREHRCDNNGGSSFGVMNWINEHIDNPNYCEPHCRFPSDFDTLTEDEWLEICDRYRGCCGEKIRPPDGPHWDAICELPDR